MALTSFLISQTYPSFESLTYPTRTVTSYSDSATVTAAEVLGGLLIDTKDGAATLTLPTATLLNAAIPGVHVGTSFEFAVRNVGNNTTTVAVGTGGTSAAGNTLTIVTVNTRLFVLVVTGVATIGQGGTDSYTLYSMGVSAH